MTTIKTQVSTFGTSERQAIQSLHSKISTTVESQAFPGVLPILISWCLLDVTTELLSPISRLEKWSLSFQAQNRTTIKSNGHSTCMVRLRLLIKMAILMCSLLILRVPSRLASRPAKNSKRLALLGQLLALKPALLTRLNGFIQSVELVSASVENW